MFYQTGKNELLNSILFITIIIYSLLYYVYNCYIINGKYMKKCNQVVNTNYSVVHLATRHRLNNL